MTRYLLLVLTLVGCALDAQGEPGAADDVVLEAPTIDACGWHLDHRTTVPPGVRDLCVSDRAFVVRRVDFSQCTFFDENSCRTSAGCHGLGQLVEGEILEVLAAPYAEPIGRENVIIWKHCSEI